VDSLREKLLAKPVGPTIVSMSPERDFTRRVEVKGDAAEVEVRVVDGSHADNAATTALAEQGLTPADWEVTGFRTSTWTMPAGGEGVSARFTYRRVATSGERPPLDELIAGIEPYAPADAMFRQTGDHGYIVALGDMQFGKIDGDGVEGTLRRTIQCINRAADLLDVYSQRFDIGHVHVAWLGDHVEGFVSQGGANTFRTVLTMNEQIRLTRRVMLHALQTFAFRAERVSMAAVPGNHGEPQRFQGKGVTRYDDSHDTESLIAVADAAALNTEALGHVEFYVPETDEMTVVIDVAGTTVGHVHGHQFRPGKHFDWWEGQAFHDPRLHEADLLLAGHLHHEFIEASGPRKFIQVPSMESESTWYRHSTGTTGSPGLLVAITKDGITTPIEHVRGEENQQ
jgi:predicted phosphodiesterase